MKKIDMHIHVVKESGITYPDGQTFCTAEEILPKYEKMGVDKAVLLPLVSPEARYQMVMNEEEIEIYQKYPDKFYLFCNIDPRVGDHSSKTNLSWFLEYYKDKGAVGVGEVTVNLPFDHPMVENLFKHCQKQRMPLLFHISPEEGYSYGLVDRLGLPLLEGALQKFPDLIFLGHSQPFWAEMSADLTEKGRYGYPTGRIIDGTVARLLRKYKNLFGDLSAGSGFNAISRDPEYGYDFIEAFQDQLLYGTDICSAGEDNLLSAWLDDALTNQKISRTAYEKVCRYNALRLLEGRF